jgi:hypothetical protein
MFYVRLDGSVTSLSLSSNEQEILAGCENGKVRYSWVGYIHTYVNTYIHTYIHTYTHTYVHTYIHTYTACGHGKMRYLYSVYVTYLYLLYLYS